MTPDRDLANTDQFMEMEKRDEEQILNELQGNILKEMFYETRDKKTVVSWIGIKEIARNYGGIDVNLVEKSDLGEQWLVVVKATDKKNCYSMLGASTQSKLMDVHDLDEAGKWLKDEGGKYVFHKEPDPFVLQKAFSKAQRNAIRALILETYFAQMIDTWRKGAKAAPTRTTAPTNGTRNVESNAKIKEEPAPGFVNASDVPKVPDDFRLEEEAGFIADYIVENFNTPLETVRALIWREMQRVAGLRGVDAAKMVQASFEERGKPLELSLSGQMNDAGLDPEKVNISPEEDKVQPKKFLGDLWGGYNDFLAASGFHWIRDSRDSRWERTP
jgi:hypothetical protein